METPLHGDYSGNGRSYIYAYTMHINIKYLYTSALYFTILNIYPLLTCGKRNWMKFLFYGFWVARLQVMYCITCAPGVRNIEACKTEYRSNKIIQTVKKKKNLYLYYMLTSLNATIGKYWLLWN